MSKQLKSQEIDEIIRTNPAIKKKDFDNNLRQLQKNKGVKSRRTYYDLVSPFSRMQLNVDIEDD